VVLAGSLIAAPAQAHFQELIPSADIVSGTTGETITLDMVFTHPFAGGPVMDMGTAVQFGVLAGGRKQDLRSSLTPHPVAGKNAYRANFTPSAPGDYVFYIEPAPYWEQAERKMIVHYAKVVVDAFGAEEGWDAMVGLPVEIEPLVRPFGLWTGNIFRGVVRRDGKAVPFAHVEVEWQRRNGEGAGGRFHYPGHQGRRRGGVLLCDAARGLVGFRRPDGGRRADEGPTGEPLPVGQGALMWVKTIDMK
jgi:cobalt/nickel transport protein